jgi:hypothetical protein
MPKKKRVNYKQRYLNQLSKSRSKKKAAKKSRARSRRGGGKVSLSAAGVKRLVSNNLDQVAIAGLAALVAKAVNGVVSREVDPVSGMMVERQHGSIMGALAALFGPPVALMLMKSKGANVVASLIGSGAVVIDDIASRKVAEQLMQQAATNPMIAKAVWGLTNPISIEMTPTAPALPPANGGTHIAGFGGDVDLDSFGGGDVDLDGLGETYQFVD